MWRDTEQRWPECSRWGCEATCWDPGPWWMGNLADYGEEWQIFCSRRCWEVQTMADAIRSWGWSQWSRDARFGL